MAHLATHFFTPEDAPLTRWVTRQAGRLRAWVGRVRTALRRVDQPTAMLIFAVAVALLLLYVLSVTPISRRH